VDDGRSSYKYNVLLLELLEVSRMSCSRNQLNTHKFQSTTNVLFLLHILVMWPSPWRLYKIWSGIWQTVTLKLEICAPLDNYAVYSGNFLLTFQDNLLVPCCKGLGFSDSHPLRMGPIGCPETSGTSYHYTLCSNPEDCRSLLLHAGSLASCMLRWILF